MGGAGVIFSVIVLFFIIKMSHIQLNCFSGILKHLKDKKVFFYQNQPHTAKLNFSGVLKHFCRNRPKKHLFSVKKGFFYQNEPPTAKLSF